jgi:hypothetical protein
MLPCQPDRFLYAAIGDVHGDLPALIAAVDAARARAAETKREAVIVVLGDAIDRGPDSADCAAFLMRLARGEDPSRTDTRLVFVRGDHDAALAYDAVHDRFSSSVEPCEWVERLESLPPDDPERTIAKDYIEFVREAPAALLLRGEREGVLFAHGAVPHVDLLPRLNSLVDLDAPECRRDFTWCRLSSARRKIPNRASLFCDVGLDDLADALDWIEILVATPGDMVGPPEPGVFRIAHFVHGHEHAESGWHAEAVRGGRTAWTVTTFRDEGLFEPIRPAVLLLDECKSHAEFAESFPHAENAESAEFSDRVRSPSALDSGVVDNPIRLTPLCLEVLA